MLHWKKKKKEKVVIHGTWTLSQKVNYHVHELVVVHPFVVGLFHFSGVSVITQGEVNMTKMRDADRQIACTLRATCSRTSNPTGTRVVLGPLDVFSQPCIIAG